MNDLLTESEWLSYPHPFPMLLQLKDKASARKLRLFACACCRRIWDRLPHEANRRLVAAVEEYPDGAFEVTDLNEALTASSYVEHEFRNDQAYWAVKCLGRSFYKFTPLECAYDVAVRAAAKVRQRSDEATAQAALVREVFGNPFRPLTIDPAWLRWQDGLVEKLAQSIYATRDFSRLPALAHALEEAGCTDREMLAHCREKEGHVRGCWVVDLLLGKG